MKTHLLKAIFLVVFLSGCVTRGEFESDLASWVGSSEGDLVTQWGPPQNVYTSPDGARFLTYSSSGTVSIPARAPTYQTTMIGDQAISTPIGGRSASSYSTSCDITFKLLDDTITNWSWKGNDCFDTIGSTLLKY
jgi:hypothetical protein